jgi:hypothetical protein
VGVAELSDEILMAYVDRQLGFEDHMRVEAAVARDPDLRARVEIFRATGAPLAKIFEKPMVEPVPAWLTDMVLNYEPGDHPQKARKPARNRFDFLRWWQGLFPELPRWQMAAAGIAILLAGVGVGSMLDRTNIPAGGQRLVMLDKGRLIAEGAFDDVLETTPSMQEMRIGGVGRDAIIMRVVLTFKSKDTSYCREFEVSSGAAGNQAGVACRTGSGRWAIEAYVPSRGGTRPAEETQPSIRISENVIDSIVSKIMDGDAFDGKDEAAVLKKNWP